MPFQLNSQIPMMGMQQPVPGPADQMAKIMTLAQMMQEQQLGRMKLAEYSRKQAEEERAKQILKGMYQPEEPVAPVAPVQAPVIKTERPGITEYDFDQIVQEPVPGQAPVQEPAIPTAGMPVSTTPGSFTVAPPIVQAPEEPVTPISMAKKQIPMMWKQYNKLAEEGLFGAADEMLKRISTTSEAAKAWGEYERLERGQPEEAWQARNAEWAEITKMPEGPERTAATVSYLMKWTPSAGYASSPQAIEQELKKQEALSGTRVKEAGETTVAKKQAEVNVITKLAGKSIYGFIPISGQPITEDDVKQVKESAPLYNQLLSDIKELRSRYAKQGTVFTGDDARWYRSKIKSLQLAAKGKELYQLGVLAGPDLSMLEAVLPDPSNIKEGVKSSILGNMDIAFDEFQKTIEKRANDFYRTHGFEKQKPKNDPLGIR